MTKLNKKPNLRRRKNSTRGSQYENLEPRRLLAAVTVVTGDLTAEITEDGAVVPGFPEETDLIGQITAFNEDLGEIEFFEAGFLDRTYAGLGLAPDGRWGAGVFDAAQSLAEGESVTEEFVIQTSDGVSATIAITVIGVNDAAVITGDATGTLNEDSTAPISGTLVASDIDNMESGFAPIDEATGQYGAFSIDAAGDWTFVVDNASVQFLNENESVTDSFVVESIDGTATEVVITITGSDDATQNQNIFIDNGVLTINGGDDADHVHVSIDDNGKIAVAGSLGNEVFDPAAVDSVFIDVGAGNDHVGIAHEIAVNAIINGGDGNDYISSGSGDDTIRGGDGNDLIHGGKGDDILIGGTGYDWLRGNKGRDILMGGDQSDRLVGGLDDDIMLGGLTNFDNDDTTLNLIRSEWTRTDISAYQRAYNLYTGQGTLDGAGFRIRLGETIFSDGDYDSLNRYDPGLDWYL